MVEVGSGWGWLWRVWEGVSWEGVVGGVEGDRGGDGEEEDNERDEKEKVGGEVGWGVLGVRGGGVFVEGGKERDGG